MNTTLIRPIQPDDFQQWHNLWEQYLEFYDTTLPGSVFGNTFTRLIDPENTVQQAHVAQSGADLVGLVHFIYHAHNWRLENVCYLQDLFTAPAARGQGIGRKLIQSVYNAADANRTPSVYWLTQDFNSTARHLYDNVATLTPFIKYQR